MGVKSDRYLEDFTVDKAIKDLDAPLSKSVKMGWPDGSLPFTKFLQFNWISASDFISSSTSDFTLFGTAAERALFELSPNENSGVSSLVTWYCYYWTFHPCFPDQTFFFYTGAIYGPDRGSNRKIWSF